MAKDVVPTSGLACLKVASSTRPRGKFGWSFAEDVVLAEPALCGQSAFAKQISGNRFVIVFCPARRLIG